MAARCAAGTPPRGFSADGLHGARGTHGLRERFHAAPHTPSAPSYASCRSRCSVSHAVSVNRRGVLLCSTTHQAPRAAIASPAQCESGTGPGRTQQHPRRPGLRGSPETLDGGHSEAMPCHLGRRCRAVCAGQGVRLLPRSAGGQGPGARAAWDRLAPSADHGAGLRPPPAALGACPDPCACPRARHSRSGAGLAAERRRMQSADQGVRPPREASVGGRPRAPRASCPPL